MYTYSFEKLEAWQQSRKLVVKIYKLTLIYPNDERFGLVSQMRRASISVASNLAEGSARKTPKDQAGFYNKSYSSLIELINQLIISADLGWIENNQLNEFRNEINILCSKISALRNSCLKRLNPKP